MQEIEIITMLSVDHYRENRINLADYDHQSDLQLRIHLSKITEEDFLFLDALVFNPLKITVEDLSAETDLSSQQLARLIERHENLGLYHVHGSNITVDKEVRKKVEWELEKFDSQFTSGLNLIRGSLKKVPVYVLPQWYKISKTTDNIFDALHEKFLKTPKIYKTYLLENKIENEVAQQLFDAISNSPKHELPLSEFLIDHPVSEEKLHEAIILLEFNLMGCLVFKKEGDQYVPYASLFHEWKSYLLSIASDRSSFDAQTNITEMPKDTPIIDHLIKLLEQVDSNDKTDSFLPLLHTLGFINTEHTSLTSRGKEWLEMPQKNKCFIMFNSLLYQYLTYEPLYRITTEQRLRECTSILVKALSKRKAKFSVILETVSLPLHKDYEGSITRVGKTWSYAKHTLEEKELTLLQHFLDHFLCNCGIINKNGSEYTTTCIGEILFK